MSDTPKDVLKFCKDKRVQFVDLRFMDFPGLWQHTTVPITEFTPQTIEHGFGFDGSCIRGWQAINETDMLLVPILHTARLDPFMQHTTLSLICDVRDPITKKEYSRDPRSIARKTEAYLKKTKIADRAMFGPELEFFIFDHCFYDQGINFAKHYVGSREGIWGRGDEDPTNLGYKIRLKEGYFPCPPMDTMQNIRSEIVASLMELGIPVEAHHHEGATGGQCEIDMRYQDLVTMSDNVMYYKYVAKNVAARHGKVATFMPKPLFQDNGSGMHVHFSLWKGDKPLFAGNRYAGLSDIGLYAIGGILKHGRALCALGNPTTNSYKRLVPGYEAPVNLIYSSRNRSAAIRIPMYSENPKTKRLEFRCPDSSCNPYLAFACMLGAGLKGVEEGLKLPAESSNNIFKMTDEELKKAGIKTLPKDLGEAIGLFEQSALMKEVLGDHIHKFFVENKKAEWSEYVSQVSEWELDRYLSVL